MNPAGVVALATALRLGVESLDSHRQHVRQLRELLWNKLASAIDGLTINGPPLESESRLPGNLNVMLPGIEGQAWLAATPEILFSSGSACSGHEPAPSHVLTALGLRDSEARRSVRFGLGRFNTTEEIEAATDALVESFTKLVALAP
jgi:cysteine desulfurase